MVQMLVVQLAEYGSYQKSYIRSDMVEGASPPMRAVTGYGILNKTLPTITLAAALLLSVLPAVPIASATHQTVIPCTSGASPNEGHCEMELQCNSTSADCVFWLTIDVKANLPTIVIGTSEVSGLNCGPSLTTCTGSVTNHRVSAGQSDIVACSGYDTGGGFAYITVTCTGS